MSTPKAPAYLISYLISGAGNITVHMNGKTYTAGPTHSNHKAIKEALKKKNWRALSKLFDVGKTISKRSRKTLKVKNGQVYYGNEVCHNVVAERIMEFIREGYDFQPLLKFLRNLLQNPSERSKEYLYRFMEANNLPVTVDGYMLAYKVITNDYKDHRTKSFDNSVGKTVKMPRENVVEDPNLPCQAGLHVGGLSYCHTGPVGGSDSRIVLVKVNPRDVVSVPYDYNNAKCRCCEYTVVADYVDDSYKPVTQKDVAQQEKFEEYNEPDDDEDYDDEYTEE